MKEYLHTAYLSGITELSNFLETLKPEDFVSVTQKHGYTVIYKSTNSFDNQYARKKRD